MRTVVQRVIRASVDVDSSIVASIGKGLLVLLGAEKDDSEEQTQHLASRIINMRIFEDSEGKMNLSVIDIGGEILTVPQFTLAANVTKGRRPSFDTAAPPDRARQLFEVFADSINSKGVNVARGAFQEHMHVSLVNDGPVTFVVEAP